MPKQKLPPVFKEYTMGQMVLLLVDLEEEIEPNHLVRVVNTAIEKMDLRVVYEQYKEGGTSSYDPKMLLKVLIYAYSQQIYSSRKIAKALRENIYFMWLSGNSHPDFHTINRFRGKVVNETITEIFAAVLTLLVEGGYVKLGNYFVDGTKLEANASQYSFVWAKNTKRYKEQVQVKVAAFMETFEQINAAEDAEYGEGDLPERGGSKPLDAAQIEAKINELNARLRQMPQIDPPEDSPNGGDPPSSGESAGEAGPVQALPGPGAARKKGDKRKQRHKSKAQQLVKGIRQLAEEYLPRLKKYEEQDAMLGERNSYAKTDPDATFMRMKDDHLQNGQLKAGYNIQMGTEEQFVVGYSLHQRPGDPGFLIPHLEETQRQRGGQQPQNVVADSTYGSEENYAYLEQAGMQAFVKYNTFNQETKPRRKPKPFAAENMPYDETQDTFPCPNGQLLRYKTTCRYRSDNGHQSERRIYECADCSQCPLKEQCTRAQGNRQIQVSFRL
jgi:transposase